MPSCTRGRALLIWRMWRRGNAVADTGLVIFNGVSAAISWVQFPPSAAVFFERSRAMIRAMTRADLPDVMRIWIEGNLDAHDFVSGDYWRGNYERVRAEIQKAEVWVCEEKGEVIGFIGLRGDYVAGLFADRANRGRGVGKQLLTHAKSRHAQLSLHVFEQNARAVSFYLREGFSCAEIGTNSDAWQREYLMRWQK